MCGRYGLTKTPVPVARRIFGSRVADLEAFRPRFNIAPAQRILAMTNDGTDRIAALRWGLIPEWIEDPRALKLSTFNARIESLATSPMYRGAFRSRRCVIFADGFFEWTRGDDGEKRPFWISRRSGEPFCFAGLWDEWKSPEDDSVVVRSATIITQPPNEFIAAYHSRMPVVLTDDRVPAWVRPGEVAANELIELLEPSSAEGWQAHAVSARVGGVRLDDPSLIEPVEPPVAALRLF